MRECVQFLHNKKTNIELEEKNENSKIKKSEMKNIKIENKTKENQNGK